MLKPEDKNNIYEFNYTFLNLNLVLINLIQ